MIRIERYSRQLMLAMSFMLATFLAGCGGGGGGGQDPILGTGAIAGLMSISVTPANSTTPRGLTRQFIATGVYSDGTTRDISTAVVWSSGTTSVATVNGTGLASGLQIGSTLITATFGTKSGNTTLTVTAAVLSSMIVTPVNPSVVDGLTRQFTAIGAFSDGTSQDVTRSAAWTSATLAVATMNASGAANSGLATGLTVGTSLITATLSGISANTTLRVTAATLVRITVTPLNPSVVDGLTRQFAALGTFTDGTTEDFTTQAIWASATTTVATMNASGLAVSGLATGQSAGTSLISATFRGLTGSTTLTVTPATLVSIAVTPTNPTVIDGLTRQFTALGTFTDGSVVNVTTSAVWSSASTLVATVNPSGLLNSGLATGQSAGTSVISAAVRLVSGSTTLTVTTAALTSIALTPLNPSVLAGQNQQFIARGTYTDASVVDISSRVVWTSNMVSVAIVNPSGQPNSGLAFGVSPGLSVIAATLGTISAQTNLTVTAPVTLNSVSVTPTNPTIAIAATQQFTAFANYSNGVSVNVTNSANWTSGTIAVAIVVNGTGLATGISGGTSLIAASFGGSSGSTLLTVTAAVSPSFVNLGSASTFGIMSTSAITSTGPTLINGNVALSPGAAQGIPPAQVNGVIHVNNAIAAAAQADLLVAYNFAKALPPGVGPNSLGGGANLSGLTLPPGTYTSPTTILINGPAPVTLDAGGNPNAVWVFQIGSSLTTVTGSVVLSGGAQAKNVFWVPTAAATIGVGTIFNGTIIAGGSVTANTGAVINGRILAGAIGGATVALQGNTVTVPGP